VLLIFISVGTVSVLFVVPIMRRRRRTEMEHDILAEIEERNVCGEPCPEHGDECPVAKMSKETIKIIRKVFGNHMNRGPHLHLCLHDVKNPHSWRE
jgi:hypothetical protein